MITQVGFQMLDASLILKFMQPDDNLSRYFITTRLFMSFFDAFGRANQILLCSILATVLLLIPGFVHAQAASGWGSVGETRLPGQDRAPLPEDQAFGVEAIENERGALVRFTPANGYYIYQARTTFTDQDGNHPKAIWPQAETHDDPHFGPTPIHRHQIEVQLLASGLSALKVDFQGCQADGICYPPMSRTIAMAATGGALGTAIDSEQPVEVSTSSEADDLQSGAASSPQTAIGQGFTQQADPGSGNKDVALAEDQRWATWLAEKSTWWIIGAFFVVGLGLSMTPCVLPMVPVVVGLVAPAQQQGKNPLVLVVWYVLAHAGVLAGVGALGAALGGGAGVVQRLQTPTWLTLGAGAFIALGAWQAGWIGQGWGNRLAGRVHHWMASIPQGHAWSAAALGAASALILGPCVAPATAGALLYVANTGSVWLGAGALFAMGIGMGAPMLLLAAGGGRLLPTAGPWMTQMTKVGAMGLLGVAALLLDRATGQQWPWAWLAVWVGACLGLWVPRARVISQLAAALLAAWILGAASNSIANPALSKQAIAFQTVSPQELEQRIGNGQAVMLDLSADWCTSCITMEKTTFVDPGVFQAVKDRNLLPLRLNLDEIDADEQAFLKAHGLIGPPAILFFDPEGNEKRGKRLVGPETPSLFAKRLENLDI